MATPSSKMLAGRRCFCFLAAILPALPAFGQEYLFKAEEQEYDWSRNLRIGAIMGLNIKGSFKMDANSSFNVNTGAGAGVYDDGYVIADPEAVGGLTSNWGCDSGSQLDFSAHTLTVQKTTSFTASGDSATVRDDYALGFELAYGGKLWKRDRLRIGWDFGFGLLPIEISDDKTMDVTANRSVFKFDTSSIWTMTVPKGGYQGSADSKNTQNLISSSGELASTNSTASGQITGKRTLDVFLFNFRVGPSLYYDISPNWAVSASAGGALGFVSGDYSYNETLILADGTKVPNKGDIGMSEIVFGGYVNGMLLYHAEDNGDLYLGVQYMPMGDASVSGKGRHATLDLGGQVQITAGINWSF